MFEKEAKERAKDYTGNAKRQVAYECGFLDGVDFVYSKANEWHYPSKGEYPKDEKYVLIYTDLKNAYVARKPKGDKYYFITMGGGFVQISAVIAWKEIILPKEIKEND